jgi:hypothetical protein
VPVNVHVGKQQAYLQTEVFKDSLAINKFLCAKSGGGEHGKTAVLELLGLHSLGFLTCIRLQAKRVETKITRGVSLTKSEDLLVGFDVPNSGTFQLGGTNGDRQSDKEKGGDLGQVADGRATDLAIEKEGRSLDLFSDEETNDSEHGNTAVGQLGLTVSLEGGLVSIGGETKRIEETHGSKGTRELINEGSLHSRGLHGGHARGKGSGRADESEEGNGEFHFGLF